MNQELLQKVLNSLASIKEYWNGSPESAVDAIETAIERADNAELNLREWLKQNPAENTFSWQCGCGNWSGVNLPTCGVCGRNRNSDQRQ
jgi:hypothetical protein